MEAAHYRRLAPRSAIPEVHKAGRGRCRVKREEEPMISLPAAEDDILISVQYDPTGLASATMTDNALSGRVKNLLLS